jgi:DNA-binding transcriptional MerR regulator
MYAAELAKNGGVSSDTVRYYTKIGMLKPRRNEDNDYRAYNLRDARRLRFIRGSSGTRFRALALEFGMPFYETANKDAMARLS